MTTTAVSITSPLSLGVEISAGTPTYDGVSVAGTPSASDATGFLIDGSGSVTLTNCLARDHTSSGIRFALADMWVITPIPDGAKAHETISVFPYRPVLHHGRIARRERIM